MTKDLNELLEALTEQHLAIVGKVGSGKTYTGKLIAEHLLERERRVCIIDPTGVWWGLRLLADGNGDAYDDGFRVAVFGGEHADVPITAASGKALAGILAKDNVPAVLDLSEFTIGDRHKFMIDFAQEIYRANRLPLHLIIDEADEFVPQNPPPETKVMLHHVDRIVRRGRVRGFRVVLITQRPAVIHKNVLTQANALIAMRLTAPQDRKALEDWIKGQADIEQGQTVLQSLPRLGQGEGWIWAPEMDMLERHGFPEIQTYDSSRTPDYDDDAPVMKLTPIDLGRVTDALAVAEEPDEKPKAKRQKAEPEIDLNKIQKEAWQDGFASGQLALAEAIGPEVDRMIDRLRVFRSKLPEYRAGEEGVVAAVPKVPDGERAPKKRKPPQPKPVDGKNLNSGAGKLLGVLAQFHPTRLTWVQTATLAKLKARGGHYNSATRQLRDQDLIVEDGNLVGLSPDGVAYLGLDANPLPEMTAEGALELWKSKLPSPAPAMLDYLVRQGETFVPKVELAIELGLQPRGGYWNTGLSFLRNNGLIEERGDTLRLSEFLRS